MNCIILGVCPIFCSLHSITNGISVIQFKVVGWQKREPIGFFKRISSKLLYFGPNLSEISEIVMLFNIQRLHFISITTVSDNDEHMLMRWGKKCKQRLILLSKEMRRDPWRARPYCTKIVFDTHQHYYTATNSKSRFKSWNTMLCSVDKGNKNTSWLHFFGLIRAIYLQPRIHW